MLATEASRPGLSVWRFTLTVTALPAVIVRGDETRPPLVTEFVPEVEVLETKDEFVGNIWVSTTFCAVFGPWLEMVSV